MSFEQWARKDLNQRQRKELHRIFGGRKVYVRKLRFSYATRNKLIRNRFRRLQEAGVGYSKAVARVAESACISESRVRAIVARAEDHFQGG